jgi:hypothetical protein
MAFAVEADAGSETLRNYLREFPQYADELVDLSRERARTFGSRIDNVSPEDEKLIAGSWEMFLGAVKARRFSVDPFANLSVARLREIALRMEVPRQVLTSFRERAVEPATVPRSFLTKLAALLDSEIELLTSYLAMPPGPIAPRSFRADVAPMPTGKKSLEELLTQAGVPAEKRAALLRGDQQ